MFELWGDRLFMRRFFRGRNRDFKSTRGRGPVDKGKPYGKVIYAQRYTTPAGVKRERYLHATKGWRDERVSK